MLLRITLLYLFIIALTGTIYAQSYNVTLGEAKALAEKIETTINNGDASVFSSVLYVPEFIKRIGEHSESAKDPNVMAGFREGLQLNDMGQQVIVSIKNGGYHFLRSYQQAGRTHILFRMFGDAGLNYHDFILYKVKDSVKAADIYIYLSGEELSETIGALISQLVPQNVSNPELAKKVAFITELKALQKKGANAEIKALIEKQPIELRKNKVIQVSYLFACQALDNDSYIAAIEDYAASNPGASNVYLMMIDAYYLKKEIEKGLSAIDKIDSLTGGDPLLNLYRGNFNMLVEKFDEAHIYFEKTFKYDPTIGSNMQQLVLTYALKNDFDKSLSVIEEYKKTKNYNQAYIDYLYEAIPELKEKKKK